MESKARRTSEQPHIFIYSALNRFYQLFFEVKQKYFWMKFKVNSLL